MYSVQLNWKNFNLDLSKVEEWLKTNTVNYVGNSADTYLTLWFSVQPEQSVIDSIISYWRNLDETSLEASSYVSSSELFNMIKTLKEGIIEKNWDQMSIAERKLVVGLTPTREDLGL